MRRENAPDSLGKEQVRHLLRVRIGEARARAPRADLDERVSEPARVARELHGRSVGERLAVPRDRRLDQAPEEKADPAEHQHDEGGHVDHGEPAATLPAAAARREPQDRARDHRNHGEAEEEPDQPRAEPHVAVQDMAELMGDDALQLVAVEVHERASRDRDRGVGGTVSRCECVDAGLAVEHVDLRHGNPRGDRHLLDDVPEPPPQRIGRVGADSRAAELLRDLAAACRERHRAHETRYADRPQHDDRAHDHGDRVARERQVLAREQAAVLEREDRDGRDDDEVDRDHDRDHRDDEKKDHPARLPPRRGLAREEVHGGSGTPGQVKATFGTSRFCGDSISRSCAGRKLNMPATMLLGNTSRRLL